MEMAKANEEGVLLIIDDEEEVVKSLKRNFRKKYQVHIATNAEEGYRLTQQFPVQVVISDQRMPGMKGTELFKKLRQERPDVVRLILTGYSDIDAIISAINDGSIFRYITKPWNPDELDAIVREAFELHELRANNKRLLHELQEANVTLEGKVEQRTTELTKINERLTQEVKDREKAEATARESKEKLQVILDSVRTGILIVDSENLVILYANLAAAEMAKIQRNDLIGENYTVFFAQETHYSYPTLETTWKIDNLESVFHTCEGEEIPVLKTVVALQLEGRRVFLESFVSIREQKKAEAENLALASQLQQAQKFEAFGTLAGGIAHDFNNLLAVILGHIDLVLTDFSSDAVVQSNLSPARHACLQAKELTGKFLTLSKGSRPVKTSCSLKEIIQGSTAAALVGSQIDTTVDFEDDQAEIECDEQQMQLALKHILINAKEAMPKGGIIAIGVENAAWEEVARLSASSPHKRYVRLTVRDQGLGISQEHLARILDPYFSTKERGTEKGMGMGLTIAQAIIAKHQGFIKIESEPGCGTKVRIYLPLREGQTLVKLREEVIQSKCYPSQPIGRRILVMEDEEYLRRLIGLMLTRLGYESHLCSRGEEAIERYGSEKNSGTPFDAVILDSNVMGGMGGIPTLQALLQMDPNTRGVVSSGYCDDPVLTRFEEYGFLGALAKPFTSRELQETLENVLGKQMCDDMGISSVDDRN